ncbi:MAG: matrixin family metalloprotease [Aliarcobacter sp.]|nr:matrixin family metalloprotease [Aliarcobacter sp.]
MIYKTIFPLLTFITFSFASFQEIKIGKIDDSYKDKLSVQQLRTIIDEIEYTFESELNMNIFDYSQNGKPIDILFETPSKLEEKIKKKMEKLNSRIEKIEELKILFPKMKDEMTISQNNHNEQTSILNKKVEDLNEYVRNINKKTNLSKDEYSNAQNYINIEKTKIDLDSKKQKKSQKNLTKLFNHYNQKVFLFNTLVNDSNRLSTEIESMSRNVKKIKGKTFGEENTTIKTYYKEGQLVKEKSSITTMNKIEIYGFDNLNELKVVLAHEIAHLVGIPHIEAKNALMNPILHKTQEEKLVLTPEDILNFKENF